MEILDKFGDSLSIGDLVAISDNGFIFKITEMKIVEDNSILIRGREKYPIWVRADNCVKCEIKDNYLSYRFK